MRRAIFGSLILPLFQVPQNNAYVIERLGKYARIADPGLHFKLPFVEYVGYAYSLKEQVARIDTQSAITKDNVMIKIDGVLYYKITNPLKASYDISNPVAALTYMAQTSMRSEIGKIDLDTTFKERAMLNSNIKAALNHASKKWGIECMRYEIKDIKPPEEIKRAMELQAEHERLKRNTILRSEGTMTSEINIAEGEKQASVLRGEGEAARILQEARGLVKSLQTIGKSLEDPRTEYAVKLKLCMNYLQALKGILQNAKTIMLPQGQKSELLTSVVAGMSFYTQHLKNHPALLNEGNNAARKVLEEKIKHLQKQGVLDSTDTDNK
eukprot:TRINITY_DN4412_c0_g1_i6.p1 TRINITY_DN4412_c0_g1~~TRINITY_DN4412_c0_g1_i6.p1  ORF type:complete len:325 (-),score=96.93 TRINITY_DN4412_c0_g1_i6:172-1146(-)